jgi:hypothetical protein
VQKGINNKINKPTGYLTRAATMTTREMPQNIKYKH